MINELTPPPELVQKWARYQGFESPEVLWSQIATQAARWGADQELEACCKWLETGPYGFSIEATAPDMTKQLRTTRRPEPPSLKKQALEALDEEHADMRIQNYKLIRSVLESLPD